MTDSDVSMGVRERCEIQDCHRETQLVVEFPGIDEIETWGFCEPCFNSLILGSTLNRNEIVERQYVDTNPEPHTDGGRDTVMGGGF